APASHRFVKVPLARFHQADELARSGSLKVLRLAVLLEGGLVAVLLVATRASFPSATFTCTTSANDIRSPPSMLFGSIRRDDGIRDRAEPVDLARALVARLQPDLRLAERALAGGPADDDAELGLVVDLLGDLRDPDRVTVRDQGVRPLGEEERPLGQVDALLLRVVAVVEADADDLLGGLDHAGDPNSAPLSPSTMCLEMDTLEAAGDPELRAALLFARGQERPLTADDLAAP